MVVLVSLAVLYTSHSQRRMFFYSIPPFYSEDGCCQRLCAHADTTPSPPLHVIFTGVWSSDKNGRIALSFFVFLPPLLVLPLSEIKDIYNMHRHPYNDSQYTHPQQLKRASIMRVISNVLVATVATTVLMLSFSSSSFVQAATPAAPCNLAFGKTRATPAKNAVAGKTFTFSSSNGVHSAQGPLLPTRTARLPCAGQGHSTQFCERTGPLSSGPIRLVS
jgi:hypothetical protein